jgi:hypothetical protein
MIDLHWVAKCAMIDISTFSAVRRASSAIAILS